jgi:serine/threonine protein kinase
MPANTELLQEGRYRVLPQAAINGLIHEAYDTVSETNVWVKEVVIRTGKVTTLSQQESIRRAYADQAKRLCSIKHDRLIRALDYFTDLGRQYLVLEAVEGDDFATLLAKNQRPFALADVLRWADQMLDGLNYLHNFSPQIIHKNIRPRNIRLAIDGNIKLTAYGLAENGEASLTTSLGDDSPESTVLNYSPLELIWENLDAASQKVILSSYDDRSERLLKQPPDARSDIYSVSATLYHLLTAKMPVDPLERSIEILDGKPDPLKSPDAVNSGIPPEVAEVVMRGLQIKREHRYDSASIMRQVLKTAMVRVREREEEEARDLAEAAEVLRSAKTGNLTFPPQAEPAKVSSEKPESAAAMPPEPVKSQSPTAEASPDEEALEKIRQAEILERKLREAEEQRLLAEKRAAEMERLLKEKEAEKARLAAEAAAKAKAAALADDDLLGIISPASGQIADRNVTPKAAKQAPDSPAKTIARADNDLPATETSQVAGPVEVETPQAAPEEPAVQTPVVEDARLESVEQSAEPAEAETVSAKAEYKPEPPVETVQMDVSTDQKAASASEEAMPATGAKLPIPMIAGAAAALLVLVLGAWMFLGSSSRPENPAETKSVPPTAESVEPSQPSQSSQTAPPSAFNPSDQGQADASTVSSPETRRSEIDSRAAAKPTPAPAKSAKPTPDAAKPEQKKKVTVDDLINDN